MLYLGRNYFYVSKFNEKKKTPRISDYKSIQNSKNISI